MPAGDAQSAVASEHSRTLLTRDRLAVALIAALLVCFAALSWTAARGKSPTYDEPLHAIGAWNAWHRHDYRLNPEDPPLWHYWAALPNGRDALRPDTDSALYRDIPRAQINRWQFVANTFSQLPGPDADRFIQRSRAMMLVIGVALGGLIAWWAWRLGGPAAAIVATALWALDPNFLAHAALVKNDVAFSLALLGASCAVWHAGWRLGVVSIAAVCVMCGVSLVTKFSGVLVGPIVALMLIGRVLLPEPWPIRRYELSSRARRLGAAVAMCGLAAAASAGIIWLTYGLRFAPMPDSTALLEVGPVVRHGQRHRGMIQRMAGAQPAPTQPSATGPGEVVPDAMIPRAVLLMQQGRLLPQAWLYGLLYTHETALSRSSFLLDELNVTGSWRYFPLAMAFKSPLALLAAAAGALAIAAAALAKRGAGAPGGTAARFEERWAAICLMVPAGVYLLVALGANINIGLRHVLPVYPFVYIGIGLAAARAWRGSRGVAMVLGVVLGLGLVAETALAHPNYLAFFNALAGGPRGGLRLLGDSNLDWGQDLKLLAEWKQRHPDVELYLSYFGSVDPTQFGVDQHPTLLAARWGGAAEQLRTGPGRVLAVSATNLQTIYAQNESQRQILQLIRDTFRPMEVLGGTIYLYDLNTMAAYAVFGPPSPPSAPAATAPATQTRPEAGGRSR